METYDVVAKFDGTWWTFEIGSLTSPSGRGAGTQLVAMGQSRQAKTVPQDARDLAALWTDQDPSQIDVIVTYENAELALGNVERAKRMEEEGRHLIQEASVLRRVAVKSLRASGLSQADAATILGISRQRVQQLESNVI